MGERRNTSFYPTIHQYSVLVWFAKRFPKKCYITYHIDYLSHRILRYMHRALNVDEKKLIAQFGWKLRDERFEPN